jgi:hypothetical protein
MADQLCSECQRPLATAGVGGVTEDTLSFCLGPNSTGCLAWKRRQESAPGEPPPDTYFGMKPKTAAKVAIGIGVTGLLAFLVSQGSKPPPRRSPPKRRAAAGGR